jgi:hypothetical protein
LAHELERLGQRLVETVVSSISSCCTPQKETQQDHVATTLQKTELHLDRLERLKEWENDTRVLAKAQLLDYGQPQKNNSSELNL